MTKNLKRSKPINVLYWFKPTSSAKGLLLFAIVFAVIGGSYMTYKSFAQDTTITHGANQMYSLGNAYTANDCSQSKGCTLTWVAVIGGGVGSNFGYIPENGSIACFTARKVSANQAGVARFVVRSSNIHAENITLGTNYSTKCFDKVPKGNVILEVHNVGGGSISNSSNLQISSMSVNYGTVL